MFAPSRDQARQFFFDTWRKYSGKEPLQGLEALALDVILMHPEYHALLDAPERTGQRDYTPDMGQTNPFLHLSLHLALEEQRSIDQPQGIRAALDALDARRGDRHQALHTALECLGEMLWDAQRNGRPPDAARYLQCLARHRRA